MRLAEQLGVEIISLKGQTSFLQSIRATPEHTVGLIIALLRNYELQFLIYRMKICGIVISAGATNFTKSVSAL